MNCDDIDRRHRRRRGPRTPHHRRSGAHRGRGNQADEDPVCQAEEGIVQVVSGGRHRHICRTPPDVVPWRVLVVRSSGPSRMMADEAGAAVPPECPPQWTHPDSGYRGSGDGNRKNGVGGGSSTDRDNDLRRRWRLPSPPLSSWGGYGRRDDDDGRQKEGKTMAG